VYGGSLGAVAVSVVRFRYYETLPQPVFCSNTTKNCSIQAGIVWAYDTCVFHPEACQNFVLGLQDALCLKCVLDSGVQL
jgi:hypothetical protein